MQTEAPTGPAVVWDLGNVLIPWDIRRLYASVILDPDDLDRFCNEVLTLQENAVLDRGTPLPEMVEDLAFRHPQHRALIELFGARWDETLGPPIAGSVALLREVVERGHRCYSLTNWGADTYEMVAHRYAFLDWFNGIVVSGREGVVKPERKIFDILCTRHRVDPKQSIFIDDSAKNVAAATDLGFDSILFRSPDLLRESLSERGIVDR